MRFQRFPASLFLFLCFALAGFVPSFAQDAPAAEGPAPRIQIEPMKVDMGEIVRGETGKARFTVRNTGDKMLKILHVKPG